MDEPIESQATEQVDQDSPWKELLEAYFEEFMAFFFPAAHTQIDWSRGYEFLDKELQQVVREADTGKRYVDKLVKVWLIGSGQEAWILVHIEVQGKKEAVFSERMYIYNYRLFDRYHRQVASFAVLADTSPKWKPTQFQYELLGTVATLQFQVAKLLEYKTRWTELEQSSNPFAVVVMAHLRMQETRKKPEHRYRWKFMLVKMLYQKGYTRKQILDLLRFMDWILVLPSELEQKLTQDVKQFEEESMPYVTSWERQGFEKGVKEGIQQGIQQGKQEERIHESRQSIIEILELKFQVLPKSLIEAIQKLDDYEQLRLVRRQAVQATSLDEFSALLGKM